MMTLTYESAVPFKEIKRYGKMMGNAGIVMKEVPGANIVQLTAFPGTGTKMRAAILRSVGIELSGLSGQCGVNTDASIRAIWIGPESYLIFSEDLKDGELFEQLHPKCSDHALVSDQSAGRACFELKGKNVLDLLMSECPVDLSPKVFSPGQSCASQWAGIGCIVYFNNAVNPAKPIYNLFPNRSFAQSLWEELCHVGKEYGVQIIG